MGEERLSVVRIESNVKGDFAHQLGPCTLLVGKNAQGKSRVIDGLSLALTGQARSAGLGKRESDLMLLAPPGADTLFANVTLSNGEKITWECSGSTAKATRAVWSRSEPAATFLFDEAIALLRADPKRLREALVARLGGSVGRDEIAACVDPIYHDIILPLFRFDNAGAVPLDAVIDASGVLAARLKEERALIKRHLTVYETRPEALTDDEEEELAAMERALTSAAVTKEQVAEMRARRESLATQHATLSARLEALDVEAAPAEGIEYVVAALGLLDVTIERLASLDRGACKCIVCGHPATRAWLEERRALAQSVVDQGAAARAAVAEHGALEQQAAVVTAQIDALDRAIGAARVGVSVDVMRLAVLRQRAQAVQGYLEASNAMATAQQRENALKGAVDALGNVVAVLIDRRTEALQKAISAALPRYQDVRIQLRDGARQVCRLSMVTGRGQEPRDIRALSGAERALLVSAFASAVMAPAAEAPVSMVLIDEVWLDGDSLRAVMRAMERAVSSDTGPSQAIIAVVSYRGDVPPGWTVINLGGE
jgi:DNA repair exonuclease SbcCD ATPase subunit